jgi:hypothetical protein
MDLTMNAFHRRRLHWRANGRTGVSGQMVDRILYTFQREAEGNSNSTNTFRKAVSWD